MATKTSINNFVQRHGTAVDELKVPSLEYLVQLRIVHMYTRNYPEDAPVTCISMCHIFYVSTFKLAFASRILSRCIYFLLYVAHIKFKIIGFLKKLHTGDFFYEQYRGKKSQNKLKKCNCFLATTLWC